MRISEAARAAGVGVETIRFYERKGLIEQPRRPPSGGHRSYSPATIERIRFIRRAQDIGFALREIKALLDLSVDPAADCSDVRERASSKLAEVNRKIESLLAMRAALEELIEACPGRSAALSDCSILEALTRTAWHEREAKANH